jgi:hypothetical protein
MPLPGFCLVAVIIVTVIIGAAWFHLRPLRSMDRNTSSYSTKADAVLCKTPFQIRKAIVAAGQDDSARIRNLACTRPGAGKRVRLVSIPGTKYGPWQIELISNEGVASRWWGYADQFEPDED